MSPSSRARDYMNTSITIVSPDMEIMQLVHLLVTNRIAGAVVVDAGGALAGMITERDCIAIATSAGYFDEPGGRVANFMTSDVQTVGADESIMDVAQRMSISPHRMFPVVDEDRRVLGLLSRRHVLEALTSGQWFGEQLRS